MDDGSIECIDVFNLSDLIVDRFDLVLKLCFPLWELNNEAATTTYRQTPIYFYNAAYVRSTCCRFARGHQESSRDSTSRFYRRCRNELFVCYFATFFYILKLLRGKVIKFVDVAKITRTTMSRFHSYLAINGTVNYELIPSAKDHCM